MRRKDREITDPAEIKRILDKSKILHLSLADGQYPYIVPLHYGVDFDGERLIFYMHSAKEGHKLDLISANPHACVEIDVDGGLILGGEIPCRYGAVFASVIAKGKVEILAEPQEKIRGLRLLMKQQTGREFAIDEKMADTVAVLRFVADTYSAKARKG